MSALTRWLERLRRLHAVPGAPARPVAVPSAGDARMAEVSLLFADLDELAHERQEIVARAGAQARALEAQARERARQLLIDASADGAAAAEHILERRRIATARQVEAIRIEAEREATRILIDGHARAPALVDRVVAVIRGGER